MEYNFSEIEKNWQQYWEAKGTYEANEASGKPKYYILDMFPYPSGAGLHVGHPLGYIASDIVARYKRHQGFEVLHPMGYDAFGLPAEQFAIDTGNHPADFTDKNIARYEEQMKMLGLSFDWSRKVKTSDPDYYKWTQWIFIHIFHSWYNNSTNKAEDISTLVDIFKREGNGNIAKYISDASILDAAKVNAFSAEEWASNSEDEKYKILLDYRLAYIGNSEVNWCAALGTVLANEEVKDGVSERGGYPVVKKMMQQWFLRITAFADRLLSDLDTIDWPEPVKEMQRNWIGKSVGAEVDFSVVVNQSAIDNIYFTTNGSNPQHLSLDQREKSAIIRVFTTRPDTIFGATFMVLAPEHALVDAITTEGQRKEIEAYKEQASRKSERERMSEVKKISGAFTGAYAINPFTHKEIPIWIADYVLAGYGQGAIMAVPAHDSRDWAFAKHFGLDIVQVVETPVETHGRASLQEVSYDAKDGELINSGFLNGLQVPAAINRAIEEIEKLGIGKKQINYRLRDANFSRQRYWGEPFPIVYKNGVPYTLDESELPVVLPEVESYKPTGSGESPLAAVESWVHLPDGSTRETNTMPGWAGSSWYFLRYMDPHNDKEFVSKEREQYWKNVDFYIGGSEHATGHLLYSRFWHKFLCDRGFVSTHEPFKKLINQGMIQGRSSFVYRLKNTNTFISKNLIADKEVTPIRVDVSFVENDILNINAFKNWREEYNSAEFNLEGDKYICGWEIEKMSKSKYNVITPDDMIAKYGCDTFRMYEMFLGPIEQSKPWNTEGIDGVSRFLKKLWNLYISPVAEPVAELVEGGEATGEGNKATQEELKILHKTIKKVTEDIERFSLNTCISSFMICVNELGAVKCNKKEILEPLTILLSPFAPHISEELWKMLGNIGSVTQQPYPKANESYLVESSFEYPISINGKLRAKLLLDLSLTKEQVEAEVLKMDEVIKWTNGENPKKIVIVPGRIVNVVV